MRKFYSILVMLLLFSFHSSAQGSKDDFLEIEALLQQKAYDLARPKLVEFNKLNPYNAYSHFWLARVYKEKFESLYIHNNDQLSQYYDLSVTLFDKAKSLVDKKELKRNRDFYDALFGRKNYTIESVQAYMDEFVQSMQKHFTKLTQARMRFALIPDSYELSQAAFVQVITNYETATDLFLKITDRDIEKLENIQKWDRETKSSIESYNQLFRNDRFADNHKQKFTFTKIEGMKSYRVDKRDFLQQKVKLFDYGTWAGEMLEQIGGVKNLLAGLVTYNDTLNSLLQMEQFPLGFSLKNLEAQMDAWQREFLRADPKAESLMEWYNYRMKKLHFYENQLQVRRDFALNYPDLTTRNRRINALTSELVGLMQEVRRLDTRPSSYSNHQAFVEKNLGNEKQMKSYKVIEERLLNEVLREWNLIRMKMPDIAPIYPDSTTSAMGQRLVLRPAKMNIQALLDSGFFLTQQVYPCLDSGFVVRGKYERNKESRQFLAKINRQGTVQWLTPFEPAGGELTRTVEQVTPYDNGMTLFFSRVAREGGDRLKMRVLSSEGALLMERLVARIPERMFLAQDAPGVIIVHKVEEIKGMLAGFEKYEIVGYRFDGGTTVVNDLLLRGNVVDIVELREGIRIVANFLEYQDLNGQFAESRAYTKGGYNVFVADFYLTGKRPNLITPIYSLKPIAVSSVEVKPEGDLLLYGSQGDFEYHGPKSIIGGDSWEMEVK